MSSAAESGATPQGPPADQFKIPTKVEEKDITNSYYLTNHLERLAAGRDMRTIISADNAETGVGKTMMEVVYGKLVDPWGFSADKGVFDPREYSVRYDQLWPGSVLAMEEAERALERRRSMSNEVLKVGHDFMTKRYRQIFGVLTLPSKDMMDARIADKLCDFWILITERGKASVYELRENQFNNKVYYHKREHITFPNYEDDPVYKALEAKKIATMTGETKSDYVRREEFEEMKSNFWNKATKKATYEFIKSAWQINNDPTVDYSFPQSVIADIVGLSQQRVSQLVNTASFEEAYDSRQRDFSG